MEATISEEDKERIETIGLSGYTTEELHEEIESQQNRANYFEQLYKQSLIEIERKDRQFTEKEDEWAAKCNRVIELEETLRKAAIQMKCDKGLIMLWVELEIPREYEVKNIDKLVEEIENLLK